MPAPPLHRVRRLSYSALALFDRCSYRYYAERIAGMRPEDAHGSVPGQTGLAATEVGDAVHRLLETVDMAAPAVPDLEPVRGWYPAVTDEELARIRDFVASYCGSELAQRIASLPGAAPERPFAFEHDGVLLHGRLDVYWSDGSRALVLDYKTNSLAEGTPEEIVEGDYRLQRLVYALACLRTGAEEVEVVYHFLERPDAVVSTRFTVQDTAGARGRALRGDRPHQRGQIPPDAERVHVLRVPGARPGLRRPTPAEPRTDRTSTPRRTSSA